MGFLPGPGGGAGGPGRALGKQDFVFPTYREHGVAWCLGVDPVHLLALFRGVDLGGWDPQQTVSTLHDRHRAQTLHATGYAMGVERDGLVGTGDPDRDMAVVCYFSGRRTSEGDVNEAFIFASSYNAPIVFICQNNQWAISEPIERQSRIPLYRRASASGSPACASTAMTCWRCTQPPQRPSSERVRAAALLDRGLHLSHGRPHHLR